jgi:hypothetical protein
MIWFGSSAGVALCNMYPQGRSVGLWLKHGWHVALAYVVGFFVLLAVLGWHPNPPHKQQRAAGDSIFRSGPLSTCVYNPPPHA